MKLREYAWTTRVRALQFAFYGLKTIGLVIFLWILASPAFASANSCLRSALNAAQRVGVPQDVMIGITRVETGRGKDFQPWPWAIGVRGEGHFFSTKSDMDEFVKSLIQRGERNFDVGCFQINFRWHIGSYEAYLHISDPKRNGLYAARYLSEVREHGAPWSAAVGAYHSKNQSAAQRYLARFAQVNQAAAFETYMKNRGEDRRFEVVMTLFDAAPSTPLIPLKGGQGCANLGGLSC